MNHIMRSVWSDAFLWFKAMNEGTIKYPIRQITVDGTTYRKAKICKDATRACYEPLRAFFVAGS